MELNLSPKFKNLTPSIVLRILCWLRKTYFFLTLLILNPTLYAQVQFDITLEQAPFIIHCAQQDSIYAAQAGAILLKAFEEIAYDLGIESYTDLQVYIMPTRKAFIDALKGDLPKWAGAFAVPSQHLMVIKSPRWDKSDNYSQVLIHELAHLVVHELVGARDLPRWIDEGTAIFYSGEDRWRTDAAVSKALATGSVLPLSEVDDVLTYHRAKADLAYQQSFSAVNYLLATYDIEALVEIIHSLKDGVSVDGAFLNATGSTLNDFEGEWRAHIQKAHRWLWLYEINEYIWALIFLLAVLALIFRKVRNKRIEREWRDASLGPLENDSEGG